MIWLIALWLKLWGVIGALFIGCIVYEFLPGKEHPITRGLACLSVMALVLFFVIIILY